MSTSPKSNLDAAIDVAVSNWKHWLDSDRGKGSSDFQQLEKLKTYVKQALVVHHETAITAGGRTYLTNDQIEEIRKLSALGFSNVHLADKFGVHGATVSRIVNRKSRKR